MMTSRGGRTIGVTKKKHAGDYRSQVLKIYVRRFERLFIQQTNKGMEKHLTVLVGVQKISPEAFRQAYQSSSSVNAPQRKLEKQYHGAADREGVVATTSTDDKKPKDAEPLVKPFLTLEEPMYRRFWSDKVVVAW